MIRLAKSLTDTLVSQPETGIGWQLVEARIGAGKPHHALVLNGQIVLEARGYVQLLREATDVEKRTLSLQLEHPSPELRVRALTLQESRDLGLVAKRPYAAGRGPAAEAPIENSRREERFLRFSAYAHDVRILGDGSVRPGTYVTTHDDGIDVTTGLEAVERYALPNPEPAVHRFHLGPPEPILVRRGTVQPAFGHRGGGAEVIFQKGAPRGTKDKQDTIPPRGRKASDEGSAPQEVDRASSGTARVRHGVSACPGSPEGWSDDWRSDRAKRPGPRTARWRATLRSWRDRRH